MNRADNFFGVCAPEEGIWHTVRIYPTYRILSRVVEASL